MAGGSIHDCADSTCLGNNERGLCVRKYFKCNSKTRKRAYKRRKRDSCLKERS